MPGRAATLGRYGRNLAPEIASFAETPLARMLGVLGGRWTVLTVQALDSGFNQFNQLQRRLDGISHKVLVDTLRSLQRDGFVHGPLTCDGATGYRLTTLGRDLVDLVDQLRTWAEARETDLAEARDAFDTRGVA